MNDNEIRESLYDYVRGRLSKAQAKEIEARLARSDSLRQELEVAKEYFAALDDLEPVAVSGDFLDKVHERIRARPRGPLAWLFFPLHIKIPLEIAGVAATFVIMIFLYAPYLDRMPEKIDVMSVQTKATSPEPPVAALAPAAEKPALPAAAPAPRKAAAREGSFSRTDNAPRKSMPAEKHKTLSAPRQPVGAAGGASNATAAPQPPALSSPAPSPPLSRSLASAELSEPEPSPTPIMAMAPEEADAAAGSLAPPLEITALWSYAADSDVSPTEAEPPNMSKSAADEPKRKKQTESIRELRVERQKPGQPDKKTIPDRDHRQEAQAFLFSLASLYDAAVTATGSTGTSTYSIQIPAKRLASFLDRLRVRGAITTSGSMPSEASSEQVTVLLKIVTP